MIRLAAIGLLLGLSGCAPAKREAAVEAVRFQQAEWNFGQKKGTHLISEHYDILTTLREPGLVQALPQVLETAYRHYRELAPSAREPAERMPVYLLATREEWERVTRKLFPGKAPLLLKVRGGGYSENGTTVIEYVAHQTTFPIMTHEGLHQYLHHCVHANIPAWVNEGLAVLCEGQRLSPEGIKSFDAWYNPVRQNALAQTLLRGDTIPLEELLRINAGHVVGGSIRKIEAYYGQVWALLLFLREGEDGKYAAGFQRLLSALGSEDLEPYAQAAHATSRRPLYHYGPELFANFISDDLATVEAEYTRFMRQRILNER